jgi:hypothetical protein
MNFEPTEEMKAAYRSATRRSHMTYHRILADLALHAMAAALEAEHFIDCEDCEDEICPKMQYMGADWLRLADKELRERGAADEVRK